ncbi:hypothetical protein T440DRAFT_533451 [Plenodomus tracheiphilus IPT5]|uniref:Uncharacterized protein n=1 Tax=Plenodomus tracheiphilus IPT5 TaxID=1408161 RepID=A0A6A7B1Q5_9PLEO|nr:hypothetical protein T440DRAFT_533451 [Plenodomus tracheiphilus IPT5]
MASVRSQISLVDILRPHFYEIRKSILHYISAYDAAKLERSGALLLDVRERIRYLSPIRDLLWDTDNIQKLLGSGMKLRVIGADVQALKDRLCDTKGYVRNNKHCRKLQIYLVGTFPVQGTPPPALKSMLDYSITGVRCRNRNTVDQLQLQRLRQHLLHDPEPGKEFLMSFGLPTTLDPGPNDKGSWQKVRDTPDCTVNLRVYVPCFNDRMWDEIRLSLADPFRMLGFSTCSLYTTLQTVTRLCISKNSVKKMDFTDVGCSLSTGLLEWPLAMRISVFVIGNV